MASRSQRPVLLNSRDTFDIYEKRSNSPLHQSSGMPAHKHHIQHPSPAFGGAAGRQFSTDTNQYPVFAVEEKKKLPMGWIIGIAVTVPIFVILVLFMAVWLQEMGLI